MSAASTRKRRIVPHSSLARPSAPTPSMSTPNRLAPDGPRRPVGVHTLISGIFSFAIEADLLEANPVAKLKKAWCSRAHRRVLDDNEIGTNPAEARNRITRAKPPVKHGNGR